MSLGVSRLWNYSAAPQSHPTASVSPETCLTTPQVTVPAVTPISDSQSPRPQFTPQTPIPTPFCHLSATHIQPTCPSPILQGPEVLTHNSFQLHGPCSQTHKQRPRAILLSL